MTKTLTRSELHKMADDFIYLSGRPASTSDVKDFADKLISAGVLVLEPEPVVSEGRKIAEAFSRVLGDGVMDVKDKSELSEMIDAALAYVERGRVDWGKAYNDLCKLIGVKCDGRWDEINQSSRVYGAIKDFFAAKAKESPAPANPVSPAADIHKLLSNVRDLLPRTPDDDEYGMGFRTAIDRACDVIEAWGAVPREAVKSAADMKEWGEKLIEQIPRTLYHHSVPENIRKFIASHDFTKGIGAK